MSPLDEAARCKRPLIQCCLLAQDIDNDKGREAGSLLPGVTQQLAAFPLTPFFLLNKEAKLEHVVVLPETWQREEQQQLRDVLSPVPRTV